MIGITFLSLGLSALVFWGTFMLIIEYFDDLVIQW